tara:strand:+ start:85 stop:543 length:459 start_codon:yes stop_codon:yes gene_type:complete
MRDFISQFLGISALAGVLGLVFLYTTAVYGATVDVDMLNKRADGVKMVYAEDIIKVNKGDTVNWLPATKGHNVEFIGVPKGVKKIKKSKLNKKYSYTFDVPGIYLYQCTPHKAMGMIGLVIVGNDVSNKNAIAKAKVLGKSKKKLKKLLGGL